MAAKPARPIVTSARVKSGIEHPTGHEGQQPDAEQNEADNHLAAVEHNAEQVADDQMRDEARYQYGETDKSERELAVVEARHDETEA